MIKIPKKIPISQLCWMDFSDWNNHMSINTMLVHTRSNNSGKDGIVAYAQYYYSTNRWKAWWSQSIVTENFNPEMGFVSRSDVIGIIWRYRGEKLILKRYVRAYEPRINLGFGEKIINN